MPKGTPYPEEFKRGVVEEYLQPGTTRKAVAARHGISQSLVSKWVRQAASADPVVPSDLIEAIEPEINGESGLIIPDSKNRIMLILALIESGYKVSMSDGQVYYEK